MWTVEYIISQICVVLAMACFATTFFIKSKKLILILVSVNNLLYAVHYLLLGSYIGAITNGISIIRGIWFFINEAKGRKKDYISLIVMNIIFIACGALTYNRWYDFIPILCCVSYTYLVWQDNLTLYRWCAIPDSLLWICYKIGYWSIIGIIAEAIMLVIKIIAVIKMYIHKKPKEKEVNSEETSLSSINDNNVKLDETFKQDSIDETQNIENK